MFWQIREFRYLRIVYKRSRPIKVVMFDKQLLENVMESRMTDIVESEKRFAKVFRNTLGLVEHQYKTNSLNSNCMDDTNKIGAGSYRLASKLLRKNNSDNDIAQIFNVSKSDVTQGFMHICDVLGINPLYIV